MTTSVLQVGIDPRGAVAGAAVANRSIGSIRTSARAATGSVASLEGGITRLKAAAIGLGGVFAAFSLGGFFISATKNIAAFELAMSGVKAVSGATGVVFEEMEDKAKKLGATTLFTASEAAEGMRFLGMAGFETQQILAAIPATLNLAIAGQLELGESADIASNVLKQFNMEAEETVRVADVMARTAADTNTSVRQMSEALKYAGPIAANVGLNIEDTAAAIGTLGDAGIQATLAGTQLRQTLLSIVTGGSDKAKNALREMGLTTRELQDALADPDKGLVKAFRLLHDAEMDAEKASAIFQRRAAAGALILSYNVDALEEQIDTNREAAGASKWMADVMADNLTGAYKQFKSAVEAVQLSLGTGDSGLSGSLKSVLNTSTGVLRVWLDMGDTLGPTADELRVMGNSAEYTAEQMKQLGAASELREGMMKNADTAKLLGAALLGLTLIKIAPFFNRMAAAQATSVANTVRAVRASAGATTAALREAQANKVLADARVRLAVQGRNLRGQYVAQAAVQANLTAATLAQTKATMALSAAQRAATATTRLLSAATTLLRRAFWMLGGPAGLIFIAAEALLFWKMTTREAEASTQDLIDRTNSLIDSFTKAGQASVVAARDTLEASIAIEQGAIGKIDDKIRDLEAARQRGVDNPYAYAPNYIENVNKQITAEEELRAEKRRNIETMLHQLGVVDERIVQLQKEQKELDKIKGKNEEVRVDIEKLDQAVSDAGSTFENTRTELENYYTVMARLKELHESYDPSKTVDENLAQGAIDAETYARAVDQAALSIDAVRVATEAAMTEQDKLNKAWEVYNELVEAGLITQSQAQAAVDALTAKLAKQKEELGKTQEVAVSMGEEMFNALSQAAQGSREWGDSLKMATASIIEMIAQVLILQPLLESMKQVMSGGGGGGGGGGILGTFLTNLVGGLAGGAMSGSFAGGATSGVINPQFTPNAVDFNMGDIGGFGSMAAEGAIVKPKPGGSLMIVGEGGESEMILPLSQAGDYGFGRERNDAVEPKVNIHISTPPGHTATVDERRDGSSRDIEIMVRKIVAEDIRNNGEVMQGVNRRIAGPTR